jgi:hypothetical protein
VTHNVHSWYEKTSLENNLNRFWEVESVEPSTMTPEQACEEHFLTHTQHSNQMEDTLSDFQPKGNPIKLGLLAFLQNADYMQLNAG